jgi:predicted DNA-binding helix-hairpin-helix protein
MRIVLKRAVYFITCNGRAYENVNMNETHIYQSLVSNKTLSQLNAADQLSLFDVPLTAGSMTQCLTGGLQ